MKNRPTFFFYPKLYLEDLLNTPKIPPSTQVFCGRKGCFFKHFCGFFPERCFLFPKCFSFPETFSKCCSVPAFRLGTFPKSRGIYLSQPVAAVATKTCHITHLKATAFKAWNPHIAIQTLTSRFQSIISGMWKKCPEYSALGLCFHVFEAQQFASPLVAGGTDTSIGGRALLAFCAEATVSILLDLHPNQRGWWWIELPNPQRNPQAKQNQTKLKSRLSRGFFVEGWP